MSCPEINTAFIGIFVLARPSAGTQMPGLAPAIDNPTIPARLLQPFLKVAMRTADGNIARPHGMIRCFDLECMFERKSAVTKAA